MFKAKLCSPHRANFSSRSIKRHLRKNQKLDFRLGFTRWRGLSLPLAPQQIEQNCIDTDSLVICVNLTDSATINIRHNYCILNRKKII